MMILHMLVRPFSISGLVVFQVPNNKEFAHSLINCNVVSVTRMCLLVLEKMVQRKKGVILNISSASAVLPTPFMTMYSSTKVRNIPNSMMTIRKTTLDKSDMYFSTWSKVKGKMYINKYTYLRKTVDFAIKSNGSLMKVMY